ncbi:hypothetical protein [Psilogramma increta granulovirus]|uniref:Uncharacterized protein n=1 Tax=Psilogramma increta granulovirus TaxID=2953508 RepID=A0A977XUZ9_9BBAC|nr:hypothetical protein [Psilogramma increta granulovirus]
MLPIDLKTVRFLKYMRVGVGKIYRVGSISKNGRGYCGGSGVVSFIIYLDNEW